jgi:hypothetical protein
MQGMSSTEWSAYLHDALGVQMDPGRISDEVVARLLAVYRGKAAVRGRPGGAGVYVRHVSGRGSDVHDLVGARARVGGVGQGYAGWSQMRPTAHRRASARLAAMPARISPSMAVRSSGPRWVTTRVNSGAASIASHRFPRNLFI